MKNVRNTPSYDIPCPVSTQNNVNYYFYRQSLPKRKESDFVEQYSDYSAKRKRMDTSTPYRYRGQEPVLQSSPDSSPIKSVGDDGLTGVNDSDDCAVVGSCNAHTNVSTETSMMAIDTEKAHVSIVEAIAMNMVAIDDMEKGEINYCGRTGAMTQGELACVDWDGDCRFKCNNSDSRSYGVVDILEDEEGTGFEWLFKEHCCGGNKNNQSYPEELEDYGLFELFNEDTGNAVVNVNIDPGEGFGLQWLFGEIIDHFDEEDIDEKQLGLLSESKKRNKLFSIFLQDNKIPSASKRKHSPEELVTNKLRRMTL